MTKKELFDMIQKNISGFIPNIVFEDVSECIDKQGMEVELIAEVFKDTIYKQVKMPLNYFRKTLIGLAVKNIKTVDDYQKQKEEHQKQRQATQRPTNVPSWSNPDYKGPTFDDILKELDGKS